MVVLVLDEGVSYGKIIPILKSGREGRGEPQFFGQPTMGANDWGLSGAGMAAARVRPEAAGVVLVGGSLLEEKAAGGIEDKHRKGAMEPPFRVRLKFVGGAE